jgi:agmatinase
MPKDVVSLLRPPGNGIVTYSVPLPWVAQVQKTLYNTNQPQEVENAWLAQLKETLPHAKGFFIGIPTDLGAAIRRGAALGPIGFRLANLELKLNFYESLSKLGWLDVGDILCHPYLLTEEVLRPEAISEIRKAFWGEETDTPAGVIDVIHHTVKKLRSEYPNKPFLAFGGDHSISYPLVRAVRETFQERIGILHFDAHTDLREHRQGVPYNYATWAFHAYKMDPEIPLVQVGLRSSTKNKEYFQNKFKNIRQFWMNECTVQNFDQLIRDTIQIYDKADISKIYISVDVDAVDPAHIPSTGTPEANGLTVDFVNTVIRRISEKKTVVAADITEFAATIGSDEARLLSAKNISRITDHLLTSMAMV